MPEMAELVGAFRSNGVLQHARSSSWRRPTRTCCQSPWSRARKRLWFEADGAISGPMGVRREVPIEGGVSGACTGSKLRETQCRWSPTYLGIYQSTTLSWRDDGQTGVLPAREVDNVKCFVDNQHDKETGASTVACRSRCSFR